MQKQQQLAVSQQQQQSTTSAAASDPVADPMPSAAAAAHLSYAQLAKAQLSEDARAAHDELQQFNWVFLQLLHCAGGLS